MSPIRKFIIVDDDHVNNTITRLSLKRTLGEVETTIFTVPEKALEFIQNEYINPLKPTLLLLDLNMPSISGWEFLEQYDKFSEQVKDQITIYMLSSSVDPRDKAKADANQYIKGFISKPLTREMVLALCD